MWINNNFNFVDRCLEFEEFCQLSAKFLIEEDEEGMKKELKEAFRIYDKAGEWQSMKYIILDKSSHTFIFKHGYSNYYYHTLQPGNGYIPVSSLKEILQELDPKLTSDEIDGIIEEIDEDGSGTVDFDGKLYIIIRVCICLDEEII